MVSVTRQKKGQSRPCRLHVPSQVMQPAAAPTRAAEYSLRVRVLQAPVLQLPAREWSRPRGGSADGPVRPTCRSLLVGTPGRISRSAPTTTRSATTTTMVPAVRTMTWTRFGPQRRGQVKPPASRSDLRMCGKMRSSRSRIWTETRTCSSCIRVSLRLARYVRRRLGHRCPVLGMPHRCCHRGRPGTSRQIALAAIAKQPCRWRIRRRRIRSMPPPRREAILARGLPR